MEKVPLTVATFVLLQFVLLLNDSFEEHPPCLFDNVGTVKEGIKVRE